MALYYKYLINYGNTIVAKSATPFTLSGDEGQVLSNFTSPPSQPLYLYRYNGSAIVPNTEVNINNYLAAIDANTPITGATNLSNGIGIYASRVNDNLQFKTLKSGSNISFVVTGSDITINSTGGGGTGSTGSVPTATFNLYTGTTAPAEFQSKSSIMILTGTTLPATYNSNLKFNSYTGITAPSVFQSKTSINTLTGNTLPSTYLSKNEFYAYTGGSGAGFVSNAKFNLFTGTTAPLTYQSKDSINILTGTTLPLAYTSRAEIEHLSGSTLQLIYQNKNSINELTGSTLPNLYQTKSTIFELTGTTLPATYQSRNSINQYTGTTIPSTYATKSNFNFYSGITETNVDLFNRTLNGGHISGGTLQPIGGISFSISPGSGLVRDNNGKIYRISWSTLGGSTIIGGDNFVSINYNGNVVITSTFGSSDNVRLGYIRTNSTNSTVIGFSTLKTTLTNLNYNITDFIRSTIGSLIEDGCSVSFQAAPNQLKLVRSSGVVWSQFNKINLAQSSGFTKIYNTTDNSFVINASQPNTVDVTSWNDVTQPTVSALVAMTNGYWKKDMIFITPEGSMFYVYGTGEYATKELATDAPIPLVPENIKNQVLRLSTFVIQKSSTGITNSFDIRPIFSKIFGGSVSSSPLNVVNHGDLIGLGDDDHPQYLTDVRGDTRYQSQINSKLNTTIFNGYTGTTAPNSYQTKNSVDILTGTTLPSTYQTKTSINTLTGTTLPSIYETKNNFQSYTGTTAPNQFAAKNQFINYTGTTAPSTYQTKTSINTLTGTTLQLTYQSKSSINTLTGTTLPNTYVSKSFFNSYTGTTGFVSESKFNTYTGTTAPNQFAQKSAFILFTGTTAPAIYQTKTTINVYTGTTAPNQFAAKSSLLLFTGTTAPATYQSKSSINTLTGTTLPNTYVVKSLFNSYTGTTSTNISSKLNVSIFNLFTGTTAPATYQLKSSVATLTGTTLPATYQGIVKQKIITGSTYTITNADNNYIIYFANTCTVTLPVSINTDTQFTTVRAGSGTITHVGSGGAVLNTLNGALTIESENGAASWIKKNSTNYSGFGALGSSSGGGSSSYTISTIDINLGTKPRTSGTFLITGLTTTNNKPVYIQQANGPYVNKGTLDDECEMDEISVSGKAIDSTTVKCFWKSQTKVRGSFKFNYKVSD